MIVLTDVEAAEASGGGLITYAFHAIGVFVGKAAEEYCNVMAENREAGGTSVAD